MPDPPPRSSDPPFGGARAVTAAAALGGTPLGIVSVMLVRTQLGVTMTDVEAAAIGSVGAAVFGYLWLIITTLIDRHLNL